MRIDERRADDRVDGLRRVLECDAPEPAAWRSLRPRPSRSSSFGNAGSGVTILVCWLGFRPLISGGRLVTFPAASPFQPGAFRTDPSREGGGWMPNGAFLEGVVLRPSDVVWRPQEADPDCIEDARCLPVSGRPDRRRSA